MGLAAGQARYLFISSRCIDLEKGLMNLSMKELALKDRANDIAEARDYATNLQHLEFNHNKNFSYDDMMGEAALNNGQLYYLTTNDGSNKVVLDSRYAAGMKAAGVSADGGEFTNNGYDAFLNSVAGKPQSANDWTEVRTGKLSDTSAYSPIDAFKSEYGVAAPQQGMDPAKAVDHYKDVQVQKQVSFDEILKKMGNTNNFNNISNLDGKSSKGSTTLNEQYNCTGSYADLVKRTGNQSGRVCLIDDKEKLSYDQIYSRARAGFRNLANTIANKIATAYGDSKIMSSMTTTISQMENQINGSLSNHKHHSESKARNRGREDANNGLIGVAIDKTGTDQVWIYCNASELTRRLLSAASNYMNSNNTSVTTKTQGAQQNFNKSGSLTKTVTEKQFDYKEEHPYTNSNGKTYEEWTAAWNKVVSDNKLNEDLAKEYLTSGKVSIEPSQDDVNMMNRYEAIYLKALSQGWTEDNQVYNQEYLTGKLQNVSYLVNAEAMKNSEAFATVRTNDADQVKAYYDKEEREISREEKKIDIEKNSKNTELNALQTELQSAKSIIDKNVERGFNLFG